MNRRRFLHGITATSAIALTGCLSNDGAGPGANRETDDPTATDTESPMPTDEPTENATGEPADGTDGDPPAGGTTTRDAHVDTESGTDRPAGTPSDTAPDTPQAQPRTTTDGGGESATSFEVTDAGCGQQTDSADVSFDDSGGTVSVTGTIWASDLAHTATLASATVADGELTVVVAAERKSGTVMGGQCIAEIDYEATVAVDGDVPVSVVVRHRRGEETTTVTDVTR